MSDTPSIKVTKDGPYLVSGGPTLLRQTIGINADEEAVEWEEGAEIAAPAKYALCRCGQSANKPFCDGSHQTSGFDGEETASRQPYELQAERMGGPELDLTDAEELCAFARFCDRNGKVWNQVDRTDEEEVAETFVTQVNQCPSGRLRAWKADSDEAIEEGLPQDLCLVEDPGEECSGPIWVRGGIPIEAADGEAYEIRNRVALCRCGASDNKPFCDGSHAQIGFKERD